MIHQTKFKSIHLMFTKV